MQMRRYLEPHYWDQRILLTGVVLIALITGLLIGIAPWYIPLAPFLAVLALLLAYVRPTWAMVPYAVISITVPWFPAVDVMTVGFMALIALRTGFDGSLQRALHALPRSFWAVLAVALLAAVYGALRKNSVPFVYREARIFLHMTWVVFFLAIYGENGLARIHRLILAVAFLLGVLALAQGVFGISLGLAGRVGGVDQMGESSTSAVRVQMLGFSFVMAAFVFCAARVIERPSRLTWLAPLLAIYGGAIIVNYGRGLWFWSALAVLLSAVFFKGRGIFNVLVASAIAVSVVGFGLGAVKPEIIKTITRRVESTFDEGGAGTSYGWRQIEIQQGRAALKKSLGIGIGLGGAYRPPLIELIKWDDFPRYTHNSYLFLALKLGLPGLAIYLLLMRYILLGALRATAVPSEHKDSRRATAVGLFCFFLCFLGLSATQPELMEHPSAMLIGACLAMAILMQRESRVDVPAKAAPVSSFVHA